MREYLRTGIVLAAFAIWPVAVSEARKVLTKRDAERSFVWDLPAGR